MREEGTETASSKVLSYKKQGLSALETPAASTKRQVSAHLSYLSAGSFGSAVQEANIVFLPYLVCCFPETLRVPLSILTHLLLQEFYSERQNVHQTVTSQHPY